MKTPSPKQKHHFFATTAFGWCTAKTREEAFAAIARHAGAEIIKEQVKEQGGLYGWSCRVEYPLDQKYTINHYAPEFLIVDGEVDRTKPVKTSEVFAGKIQNIKGWIKVPE